MREQFIEKRFSEKSQNLLRMVIAILDEYSKQGFSLTLRQLYYQLVARDYIENSVRSYKRLGSLVNNGRLAGLVDWSNIVDRERKTVFASHWDSPRSILVSASHQFKIDKWKTKITILR